MLSTDIRGLPIPPELTDPDDIVTKAYSLAVRAHEGQTRRGGAPYITHINDVMSRVAMACGDHIEEAVAAVHDAVEDGGITLSDILYAGLPWEVFDGVRTLTRLGDEPYEAFIERIRTYRDGRWARVKAADLYSNLADDPTPKQVARYHAALTRLGFPLPLTK